MAKDWKAQLAACQEENVKLRFEIIRLEDQMEERIEFARKEERAKIAGEILSKGGGE